MYQVIEQEKNNIEIALSENLTGDDMKGVIHQLQSLCTTYKKVNVLIDASRVIDYDSSITLDEYDFFEKYSRHLSRVASIARLDFPAFIMERFHQYSKTQFRTFSIDRAGEARRWVFSRRLPA